MKYFIYIAFLLIGFSCKKKEIKQVTPSAYPILTQTVAFTPTTIVTNTPNNQLTNASVTGNNVKLTTDRFGSANSAYNFNGNGDMVFSLQNPIYGSYSISFWYQINTQIFGMNLFESSCGYLVTSANQKLTLANKTTATTNFLITNSTYQLTKWEHIVITFDAGLKREIIYKNGIVETQANLSGDFLTVSELIFAKAPNNSAYFYGNIDDIGVYTKVLTQNDVTQLFKN